MSNFCKIVRSDGREVYVNADTVAYVANAILNAEDTQEKSVIQFIGEMSVESSESARDTAKKLNDNIWPV